jgi:hypothetical protein
MEKSNDVNTEIDNLKSEIQELENYYTTYLSSIEEREARWKGFEKKIEEIQKISLDQCILNIGGNNYTVSLHTLKLRRNTIFFKKLQRQEIYPSNPSYKRSWERVCNKWPQEKCLKFPFVFLSLNKGDPIQSPSFSRQDLSPDFFLRKSFSIFNFPTSL